MRKHISFSVFLIFSIAVFAPDAFSESDAKMDSLTKQMEILKEQLSQLTKESKAKEKDSALNALLEKARTMGRKKPAEPGQIKKFHSGLRQQSALNPNISIGGEFYFATGRSRSDLNSRPSDMEWGTGQLYMREIELAVESALDPFSRGKVFLGFDGEAVSVEEAYLTWLNCPFNLNLKLGKFKNQFGQLNRYHDHALPQFDRPRALVRIFGNSPLNGTGLSGNFLLPRLWAHVNELDVEVISGGNGVAFTDQGRHQLIYVTHLKNYYDLNPATYFEFGLSAAAGKNDSLEQKNSWIFDADFTLKWQPPGRSKYKGIEWRTELLFSRKNSGSRWLESWGGFTSLQMRLGARTVLSGRLDYTQLPTDHTLRESGGALALDYWQSEFVFVRLQYTYIDRNFDESDHRLILHTCWAMGPHKHEAY